MSLLPDRSKNTPSYLSDDLDEYIVSAIMKSNKVRFTKPQKTRFWAIIGELRQYSTIRKNLDSEINLDIDEREFLKYVKEEGYGMRKRLP